MYGFPHCARAKKSNNRDNTASFGNDEVMKDGQTAIDAGIRKSG
jgi:hypothetical protein